MEKPRNDKSPNGCLAVGLAANQGGRGLDDHLRFVDLCAR